MSSSATTAKVTWDDARAALAHEGWTCQWYSGFADMRTDYPKEPTWGYGAWRSDVARIEVWTPNDSYLSTNKNHPLTIVCVAFDANDRVIRRIVHRPEHDYGRPNNIPYANLLATAQFQGPTGHAARAADQADRALRNEQLRVERELEGTRRNDMMSYTDELLAVAGIEGSPRWHDPKTDDVVIPIETLQMLLRRLAGEA